MKPRYTERMMHRRTFWQLIHIDTTLFICIILTSMAGFLILYSASGQDFSVISKQCLHLGAAVLVMLLFAQISPAAYLRFAPWIYFIGLLLLTLVLVVGHRGKGADRWLNLGLLRFQPSELLKLALPMFLAWYYHRIHLPISLRALIISALIILIPTLLTAKQPDLGTAIMEMIAGCSVLLLAGMSSSLIITLLSTALLALPMVWYVMHDYQKQRILTFLNPERDPLGAGYHIIQSKIAIGSGGLFGKGWLNGTQSHLHFLPEHSTDFIFAVCGEEFGLAGSIILICLFMLIVWRGLYIAIHAQDTFSRLLAGSIALTFFVSFFINIGMVIGILPVVGLPLPLISYGGSSLVTLMAGFGILMSIQTHRRLLTT
ncbi:MAG: rod shape-determining protein RodA [Gammaproteobacteria bacterium]|nr:rod shape-determining protein RodA [Gammaproteobacteria bacterium]